MSDHNTETMRHIGPYRLLNEIGRGAMGVVYRAFDPTIGRELAIKTLYVPRFAEQSQVTEARQRFALEAQAAGRLSHPNIVVIYQFGQEQDFEYLAMELIPGASLDKLMVPGRAWPPEEVARIVAQAASALDYAHANQVVHRDIKPGNIMVRPDGVVKVTDFGIARVSEQVLTTAGSWGTPVYMAPERINGDRGDGRADQYALAVVAYQLLANRLPFGKTGDHALLLEILQNEPAPLADPYLNRVIGRALAKDPARRFESCGAFAQALGGVPDVFTKRTAVPIPVAKPRRNRTALVLFFIFLAFLALLGIAGFVLYPHPAPRYPSTFRRSLPQTQAPVIHQPVRRAPVLLTSVAPGRPIWKRMFGGKGTVRFSATVDTDGRLRDFVLLSGPRGLAPSAMKAAEKWRYAPATVDDEPVP
ncbi:MAG TPA: protein kinase, partial [Bryobacteraceae bacterium]|nr:protein kinase [Bryobacteraceae bacterium]